MKATLLSLSLLVAQVVFGQTSVNFSAGPGQPDIRDFTGAPVTNGWVIVSSPVGGGVEYGRTEIQDIFGLPGRFAGSASSFDPIFDGQPVWLTVDSSQGCGVFTSSSWVFPIQGSIPPYNTLSIYSSDIDTALFGAFNSDHLIVFPVPEPQLMWMVFTVLLMAVLVKIYESNHN